MPPDDTAVRIGPARHLAGATGPAPRASDHGAHPEEPDFRKLIENTLDVITVLNAAGHIRYASPSVERVLGHRPQEIVGRSIFDFVHPEDAADVVGAFTVGIRQPGSTASIEFRHRHRDGSWRVLEAVGKGLLDDPAVNGVVLNCRDVTERRVNEDARRYLGAILEATTDFVATTDANGRLLYLNDAGRRMVGLNEEEDTSLLTIPDFHPQWAADLILTDGMPAAIRDGAWSGETALLAGDGSEIPVSQVLISHTDDTGGLEFLSTIMRDISERKRAEEALRHSEQHFRSLIEHALDIITVFAPDGTIRYDSPSVERVLGYEPGELVDTNAFDRIHPEDVGDVRRALAAVVAEPTRLVAAELRFRHRDGSWRVLEAVGKALLEGGRLAGIVVNARDITERKDAEAALARSEEQLRQAQKMEAVGRLAGGVAHDFNNLLTAIKGHTRLLLADLHPDEPICEHAHEVEKACDRAAALTRQLLAFSRKQVLQPRVIDLNAVLRDLENMLHRLIGEDIRLSVIAHEPLGAVRADPSQIEQVIMNLAVNARDAMPGGGRLTIDTTNVELDGDDSDDRPGLAAGAYVRVRVTDTGTGMDDEVLRHLFEPFFTTKEKGKGTGLGLATVYGIVKQSGGAITASSTVGQGTTFEILLPRVEARVDAAPADSATAAPAPGGSETILVAEDEVAVRNLVRRFLQRSGYHVLEAQNGVHALEVADAHDGGIDLLLTDVVMPEMGGRELAERLIQQRDSMAVLFMSGYTDDAIVHHRIRGLGSGFLQKPFTPELLARTVRQALDRKGSVTAE